MDGYQSLRIAIILQLKKDYLEDLVHDEQLWSILHTSWMMFLCDPVHPDKVYEAFKERKNKLWQVKSENSSDQYP